jgi:transketolase
MTVLELKAREIRGMILDQVYAFKNGHIASAFSIVEILLYLYHKVTQPEDRLIISKGHGVSALYAILADMDVIPKKYLISPQDGNALGGHPDWHLPGIHWSTGSLGHGLSVAAGMAMAARMDNKNHRIFCILGDGELQEGSVWEAALFAAHHKLDNLIAIIDFNGNQSCGEVKNIIKILPIMDKWRSFGWLQCVTNGHMFSDIERSFSFATTRKKRPSVIIAYTLKGFGVSFIETDSKWHTGIPTEAELIAAKKELGILS